MEYQFTRSITGEYLIKCSMGHEIVGRWLQEEVATDLSILRKLHSAIGDIKSDVRMEYILQGKEISVTLTRDEVIVEEHSLSMDADTIEESDLDFYDSESSAACGLEDFEDLLLSWQAFVS